MRTQSGSQRKPRRWKRSLNSCSALFQSCQVRLGSNLKKVSNRKNKTRLQTSMTNAFMLRTCLHPTNFVSLPSIKRGNGKPTIWFRWIFPETSIYGFLSHVWLLGFRVIDNLHQMLGSMSAPKNLFVWPIVIPPHKNTWKSSLSGFHVPICQEIKEQNLNHQTCFLYLCHDHFSSSQTCRFPETVFDKSSSKPNIWAALQNWCEWYINIVNDGEHPFFLSINIYIYIYLCVYVCMKHK